VCVFENVLAAGLCSVCVRERESECVCVFERFLVAGLCSVCVCERERV